MQYTMLTHYDKLQNLIDKHLDSINSCLRPLVNEIVDEDPEDETGYMKLFRKMSIYIILASGLGNPGSIVVGAFILILLNYEFKSWRGRHSGTVYIGSAYLS